MHAFRTITSSLLALLVLVSSTNITVGMHLCGGEVQNVALFSKADGCAMEQELPPCHRHATAPCCEDESVIHHAQEFKASPAQSQSITFPSTIIEQPLVMISQIVPDAFLPRTQYQHYDPPLRYSDLTVEHRVFLI